MADWYAVHTRPRQEDRALEHLRRQHYECFLPRIRERVRRAGGVSRALVPMFPRYLFVRLELGTDNLARLCSTRGVAAPVRFGSRMPPVPDGLVEGLIAAAVPAGDDSAGAARGDLEPGMRVRIDEGALAGLCGELVAMQAQQRVLVLLNLMGRQTRIVLAEGALSQA